MPELFCRRDVSTLLNAPERLAVIFSSIAFAHGYAERRGLGAFETPKVIAEWNPLLASNAVHLARLLKQKNIRGSSRVAGVGEP